MLTEFISTIITHRKRILTVTLTGGVVLFLLLRFAYPLTFESGISILPPEKDETTGLSTLLQGGVANLLGAGGNANSQLYAEMLRSRAASLYVVKKCGLKEFFGTETELRAVEKLGKLLDINVTKEGILKLSVPVTTDIFGRFTSENQSVRKLAAQIPAAFIAALDSLNSLRLTGKARKTRIYLEGQIAVTKIQLDSAEQALMRFQKQHNTISLPDQIKAAIEAAGKLKAEIITTEMNLALLSRDLRDDNSVIRSLKSKLEELNNQYNKLSTSGQDVLLSVSGTPELALTLASLTRNVKILNEVYLLLQQHYYREKIQESRDVPTVDVLDSPFVPEKETAPRPLFATALGTLFIFLASCLFAFMSVKNMFSFKKSQGVL